MHVAFLWLYVSWFHSQGMAGYGSAGPSARLLRATLFAFNQLLADFV